MILSQPTGLVQSFAQAVRVRKRGCIKFDLKAFDENLNFALCGASNRQTLKNFEYMASLVESRKEFPEEPPYCRFTQHCKEISSKRQDRKSPSA